MKSKFNCLVEEVFVSVEFVGERVHVAVDLANSADLRPIPEFRRSNLQIQLITTRIKEAVVFMRYSRSLAMHFTGQADVHRHTRTGNWSD